MLLYRNLKPLGDGLPIGNGAGGINSSDTTGSGRGGHGTGYGRGEVLCEGIDECCVAGIAGAHRTSHRYRVNGLPVVATGPGLRQARTGEALCGAGLEE